MDIPNFTELENPDAILKTFQTFIGALVSTPSVPTLNREHLVCAASAAAQDAVRILQNH